MPGATNLQSGETLNDWLNTVCQFWISAVLDENGGFFDGLDADGKPVNRSQRSILNQARLTYVFSHAYTINKKPEMLRAAEHGFAFLLRACDIASKDGGGWHRMITVDGEVVDSAKDAYDHAFVIFAMAWHYRATGSKQALSIADRTYEFMQAHLADPVHGGFFEEFPFEKDRQKLPRRQNPHMHLLEAMLAMYEATRAPQWLERSNALVTLFEKHFFDDETGTLIEYFNADWTPAAGPAGVLREPGHHFEWVWLLFEYFRHSRDPRIMPYAKRLYDFGARFGIDTEGDLAGIVFDAVDRNGRLVENTKLLWPQTEFIKACLTQSEWLHDAKAYERAISHIRLMQRHFFKPDGANWYNQLSRSGEPLQEITPSRVLYHLFLAVSEAIRLQPEAGK